MSETIVWELCMLRCPGRWTLLPWVMTLNDSVRFSWLAFEVTRYCLHDIDEHEDI